MAEQQYMEEQKRDLMSGKSAMVELGLAQNEQSEALKRCEQSIFRYAVHGAKLPTGIHLPCYAEQIAEILYPEEIEKKKRQLELDGIRRKEKLDKSKTGVQVETAESKGANHPVPKGKVPTVVEVTIRGQNYRQLALQSRKVAGKPKADAVLLPEDQNVRIQLAQEDRQLQVAMRNLQMHQYHVRKLEREIATLEKERGHLADLRDKQITGTRSRLKRFSKVKHMLQEGLAERDEKRRLKEDAAKREAAEKEEEKRAWRERGLALREKVDEWKARGEPRAEDEDEEEKARRREKLVAKWTLSKEEVARRQAFESRPPFAAVVPGARFEPGTGGRSPTLDDERLREVPKTYGISRAHLA